jgi:hypothetical protein
MLQRQADIRLRLDRMHVEHLGIAAMLRTVANSPGDATSKTSTPASTSVLMTIGSPLVFTA